MSGASAKRTGHDRWETWSDDETSRGHHHDAVRHYDHGRNEERPLYGLCQRISGVCGAAAYRKGKTRLEVGEETKPRCARGRRGITIKTIAVRVLIVHSGGGHGKETWLSSDVIRWGKQVGVGIVRREAADQFFERRQQANGGEKKADRSDERSREGFSGLELERESKQDSERPINVKGDKRRSPTKNAERTAREN